MSKKFVFVNTDGDYQETPGAYETSDFVASSAGGADAGKPVKLNGSGLIDSSMLATLDHGGLNGLGDDDHTQYILASGGRAFTGNQAMGGFLITGLGAPVNPNDAARKAYVDAIATGLKPHGNVTVATTANISLSSAPASIDGVTLSAGDRILVKNQTDATENGIYDFASSGAALTRSSDFDNSPLGEIYNGSFIPMVLEGTVNADTPWVVVSVGTGTDGLHAIGSDDIVFDQFTSPTQLTAGNGITIASNVVSVDILDAGSGLKFAGTSSDELAIDFATTFTIGSADELAIKASDLANTGAGKGASIIGIQDSGGYFTATNVEAALAELASSSSADYNIYLAGAAIAKGDLVYISANNTVTKMPITAGHVGIGIAGNAAAIGEDVQVLKDDVILVGVLTGATAGDKYYWTGTAWSTTMNGVAGNYIWLGGVAKNATDLQVETRFIKKNSLS